MKLVWIALVIAALWAGIHYFDDLNRMSGGMFSPVESASTAGRPLATGLTPAAQSGD
jgi:hypothetical protein